ncbi:hypothetical protein FB45DRAFT_1058866 [Roridomyces roridus]|uniref:Uncharacterized protein n=1 Tax=Roridomyces roridus TaxID=1738132 RepID=A0AAD7FLB5_9AGAR|nr:hypothetical protein FB45DRAFT_1058866 [Roridomyces roridus]
MSSSSSHFASFAAYTPPPDDPTAASSSSKAPARPWFPAHSSSNETSYQSGGIPTFNASASGGLAAIEEAESQQNQWETRHGLRVDFLAAFAYVLGPISALALLIIETQNDYVRFHAYQSALLTTPLVLIRIFASLLHFPGWMRTIFTLLLIGAQVYMASVILLLLRLPLNPLRTRAYLDAAQNGLARFQLPYIGPMAARWLEEE